TLALEGGERNGVHVAADDGGVAQEDYRWGDIAIHHPSRTVEMGEVVAASLRERDHQGGAVGAAPRTPRSLDVVRRRRGHVPQENGLNLADVDAQLKGRGTTQRIDSPIGEVVLETARSGRGELGGVF